MLSQVITMTATEFKAKCLSLLDRVKRTGEVIQITKRGCVVAEVGRPNLSAEVSKAGIAKGEMSIIGDIIEPLGVHWEAKS